MKFIIVEYMGDYPIDHQPFWNTRFDSLDDAIPVATSLYKRRLTGEWEDEIEAKPANIAEFFESEYHITIQRSNPDDEDAYDDPPVWGVGCIPELSSAYSINPCKAEDVISDPLTWQKELDAVQMGINLSGFRRFWSTVEAISGVDIVAFNGCPEFSSITIRLTSKIGLELRARPCSEDHAEISYAFVSIESKGGETDDEDRTEAGTSDEEPDRG